MTSAITHRFGLIGVGVAVLFALTLGTPTMASSVEVGKAGPCSARSEWTFSASEVGRKIWVELTLDTGIEGQLWRFRIVHDGVRVARGTLTVQSDGTTQVGTLLRNHRGTDRLSFHAGTQSTGETCRGALHIE